MIVETASSTSLFHTTFVKLSNSINGLLCQPETSGPNTRVAIVYSAPVPLFDFSPAAEMASRRRVREAGLNQN